ncbi:MAG: DUF4231 domain-containing protein [Phycisphaerales bacterium]|nr:DUF4231 domain-containing protein [Phycisphaerales bacterium]
MDNDTIQRYLDARYAGSLAFYDSRATMHKRWYRGLSVYVIIASAFLTAFVSLVPPEFGWRAGSAVLSASLVVATGLLAHYKSHENWLSYRLTWDALARERELHSAGIHEYRIAEGRDALFVERVEAILARESSNFYARHVKSEDQANAAPKQD